MKSGPDQLEAYLQRLCQVLEELAPSVRGRVSPGKMSLSSQGRAAQNVTFPSLKGLCGELPLWVTFSITSDAGQMSAGQPINKITTTWRDFFHPWLQIHLYQPCSFRLWITPERRDFLTKIARALRLESSGLILGNRRFDEQYLLDCRAGESDAKAFLRDQGTKEILKALGHLELLRFEESYIKLVVSAETSNDHAAKGIKKYIDALSGLAAEAKAYLPGKGAPFSR